MASSREYLDFILEQLSELDDVTYRAMMPNADMELPYDGAKEMLLVDDVDNKEFLQELLEAMYEKAKKVGRISFENDDPADVMTKLELSDGEWLLNAGAALFVDCGINELQMAKFASDERLTFTDIRRFTGPILDLADKAVQYVIDAMDWRVEFDGSLERKEIPEIPVDAVREAVINSFGHRLVESGQSVEVAIYRSFIEIYSPGKFPDGVTPEMFIKEIRKPIRRNPLITRTLYYSKDMESFATGLKRIQDACDELGCKVEYYGDNYGFTVRFYRHCGEGWGTSMSATDGTHGTRSGTHEYETQIIDLVKGNNRITRKQMASELSVSLRTIQRIINSIDGLTFVGSGRGGHWEYKK